MGSLFLGLYFQVFVFVTGEGKNKKMWLGVIKCTKEQNFWTNLGLKISNGMKWNTDALQTNDFLLLTRFNKPFSLNYSRPLVSWFSWGFPTKKTSRPVYWKPTDRWFSEKPFKMALRSKQKKEKQNTALTFYFTFLRFED